MSPNKLRHFIHLFYYLIDNHSTGNPKEFASKLGVSRATLYRFITDLRDEGINIRFSRNQNSFYIESTTLRELSKLAISQAFEDNYIQSKSLSSI
jgi:predicted DNA-binding transcriptional regulator YafY